MKTMIKISVLLNVVSLGTVIFLGEHPRTVLVSAPAIPVVAATVEPETAPAPVVQTVVAPFHWSQLMSTNGYRSLVANLRAAGCPESTVEDIVRGNVERAFDWERNKSHMDASGPGPWSAQAQTQMVAYFLGQAPNAPEMADAAAGSPTTAPLERPVNPMLVSLQDINPAVLTALNFSDEQKQMIIEVQQTYFTALNSQKQPTADASQPSQSAQSSQAGDTAQNLQNPGTSAGSQPAETEANTPQQEQQNRAQLEADADASLEAALGSEGYLGYKLAQQQTALENQLKSHPDWVSGDAQ